MLLTARNVPLYLVGRGLMTSESIVDGPVVVSDVSRRNRNFKVTRGEEPGFFVKQAARSDPISIETVRRDARCYWLATHEAEFAMLAPLLPRYHDFDVARSVLVTTLLDRAETVYQLHLRLGAMPTDVAESLARAVAYYHVAFRTLPSSATSRAFPRMAPWILVSGDSTALPPALLTPAGLELLQLVRARGVERALAARRATWRVETLMHGDLKWDNCLRVTGNAGASIRIVDWEIADVGDPAWDVGSILQAYLAHSCFMTAAAAASSDSDRFRAAQPAMRAFWSTYVAAAHVADSGALLERSTALAAARLVQTAYESLYMSSTLTPSAVDLLEVAARLLSAGANAYRIIFGV